MIPRCKVICHSVRKLVYMTLKDAKKILGNNAMNSTDEQVEVDIETAEMLKNMFFNQYSSKIKAGNLVNLQNSYEKTSSNIH